MLVSLATGILFGLIPALHSARPDLSATLKESGGRGGTGFRHNKTRTVLVVTEVALAVVLLVGSALLIRTSLALAAVKPGFDATNVLTMRMSLTGPQFATAAGGGPPAARRHRAPARPARRGNGQRHLLRAARRRLRAAVHHRGPPADGWPVPRRRRLA